MKKCTVCHLDKERNEFAKNKQTRDGLQPKCRSCHSAYRKQWYEQNRERAQKINSNWLEKNPEHPKQYYQKNKERSRDLQLKKHFGLTLKDYNAMLNSQSNLCKICGLDQKNTKKSFAVDHCHETGKIRGLLCQSCNLMLGYAKDNPEILKKAIAYIEV